MTVNAGGGGDHPLRLGRRWGPPRHDGTTAAMAPLKPRTRAPRAGRALSQPGEVTWLHTFAGFWSPSPEGGTGQVRSGARARAGFEGLSREPGGWGGDGPGLKGEKPSSP